jgi:hypothetical protein
MDEVKTITLSYTFFFVSDDAEAKAEGAERTSRALGVPADGVVPADAGG